jgi:hypothetical protein
MEILVFALVAIAKLYPREEKLVRESHPFKPLDVQALRYVYEIREKSSGRPSDRQESYVVQAVS